MTMTMAKVMTIIVTAMMMMALISLTIPHSGGGSSALLGKQPYLPNVKNLKLNFSIDINITLLANKPNSKHLKLNHEFSLHLFCPQAQIAHTASLLKFHQLFFLQVSPDGV